MHTNRILRTVHSRLSRSWRSPVVGLLLAAGLLLGGLGVGSAQAQSPITMVKDDQGSDRVRIFDTGMMTLLANGAEDGIRVKNATNDDGVEVFDAGGAGVQVRSAVNHGVFVAEVGDPSSVPPQPVPKSAFEVRGSAGNGLSVGRADEDGVLVGDASDDGVEVFDAGGSGVEVRSAANHGVFVAEVGDPSSAPQLGLKSAFEVRGSVGNGLTVGNADNTGVLVEEAGAFAADLKATKSGTGTDVANAVVRIKNTSSADAGHVLAVQANETSDNIDEATHFINFHATGGQWMGGIVGNARDFGDNGIKLAGPGQDFAEKLPVAEGVAPPEPADLVGVRGGTVSLNTKGAARLMIVSSGPLVEGGAATPPTQGNDARRVPVAFIGQVPVRLQGKAEVGDLIVASGQEDGTARAVSPSEYRHPKHGPIAGQAWTTKSSGGVGTVTVAVGLGQSGLLAKRLQKQQTQIDSLKKRVQQIESLKERVARLESRSGGSVLAGLSGWWAVLLALGAFGAGLLWRRQS